ncbi:nicotine blue oxidoreductase [Paenarthrobacter sp. PH39-S1]|uniref:nicotine blue oxidoreductase n=1 Tax=Paenarthrobacter sp. PH39-S1 TaxID=3046204 RepID=UPI0024B93473|nr:nucleotidyltransferase family protein [Paenarthrobacter sp. PH39-S1]MDJ0356230.1 nucleotidyltransferase family protein [Paenarthrobacter sp. PH39-S1]
MTGTTTAVLLAAGAGRRLGRGPKALLAFRGTTLVEHLAGVLRAGGCRDVVVVLGADAQLVRSRTDLRSYRILENPRWAEGMSTSFRLGIGAAHPGNHVLVALVDQPALTAATVTRLLEAHRGGRVTAAGYIPSPESAPANSASSDSPSSHGASPDSASSCSAAVLQRGHPVLFDSSLARQAAAVASGDSGARTFLRTNPGLVDLIDCSDQSDGADVDTVAGLHLLG